VRIYLSKFDLNKISRIKYAHRDGIAAESKIALCNLIITALFFEV